MTRCVFVLFFFLISHGGQPLLAAGEDTTGGSGSGQSAGQETTDTGKPNSGKKTAKPGDEEPECD